MNPLNSHSSDNTVDAEGNVDWMLFGIGLAMLLSVVLTIVVFPDRSTAGIDSLYQYLTSKFGALYICAAVLTLSLLLFVAISQYGNIILGDIKTPQYSEYSWAAMLFCAGLGASLIYWGATEWVFYYLEPPFGIEPRSDEAIIWAASYGIFHWGPVGWAFYCLPALALSCTYHVKKIESLRLSVACSMVLGSWVDRWPGRTRSFLYCRSRGNGSNRLRVWNILSCFISN